ncbi:MAG: 50S ribosomal protein L9 [Candidatus Omnitrophota bacterium]
MKVILRTAVPGLGQTGEIKEVADGYARNYLLPRQTAYKSTPTAEKRVAEEQKLKAKKEEKEHRGALELAARLKDVSLTISVAVGDQEQLYGSVNERDIISALSAEYQIDLDPKAVKLEEPIKQVGVYRVPVRVREGVESTITVWVVKGVVAE